MENVLNNEDLIFLKEAHKYLENPSFIIFLTNKIGQPIQFAVNQLPYNMKVKIGKASEKALKKSLSMAHLTTWTSQSHSNLSHKNTQSNINRWIHNGATMATGGIGGFIGEIGLLVELPITTTIIMRSILSQGQSYGNMSKEELIINALYVFSLGSEKSDKDDEMDTAYYASRTAMDQLIKKSVTYLASHGTKATLRNVETGGAPFILELIVKIAQRFNIVVTEKMLAGALPVVGAVSAATINLMFTDFFTQSAKYHFGIKYLEEKYGKEIIEQEYSKHKKLKLHTVS